LHECVAVAASCSQSCSHLKGAAAAAGGGFPPPSCLWESRPACPSCDMLEQLPCMRGAFAAPDEMLLCSGVEGPSGGEQLLAVCVARLLRLFETFCSRSFMLSSTRTRGRSVEFVGFPSRHIHASLNLPLNNSHSHPQTPNPHTPWQRIHTSFGCTPLHPSPQRVRLWGVHRLRTGWRLVGIPFGFSLGYIV